jgi:hypothetical protein
MSVNKLQVNNNKKMDVTSTSDLLLSYFIQEINKKTMF